jgi:hypothetical protein
MFERNSIDCKELFLAQFSELKSDPRWTKGIEYELQNRALLGELERQKAGRLHYIEQKYRKK